MNKTLLKTHTFTFNPKDNSGEHLTLTTDFYANGDPIDNKNGVFVNQKLTLHSYCNECSIKLYSNSFTPELLRQLADELEIIRKNIV
jgi:hypothetical protein